MTENYIYSLFIHIKKCLNLGPFVLLQQILLRTHKHHNISNCVYHERKTCLTLPSWLNKTKVYPFFPCKTSIAAFFFISRFNFCFDCFICRRSHYRKRKWVRYMKGFWRLILKTMGDMIHHPPLWSHLSSSYQTDPHAYICLSHQAHTYRWQSD